MRVPATASICLRSRCLNWPRRSLAPHHRFFSTDGMSSEGKKEAYQITCYTSRDGKTLKFS